MKQMFSNNVFFRHTENPNYWINLRGHNESHPTKKVLEVCWERGKVEKTSFRWEGEGIAEQMKVFEFCPAVLQMCGYGATEY